MAFLLTYEYFTTGRASIPNVAGSETIHVARQNEVIRYIDIYEKKTLRRLLGDDLYNAFAAGMAETTPLTRWTSLANAIRDASLLTSPICAFVWFGWQQDHQTMETTGAQVKYSPADAITSVNVQKMCDVYNDAVADLSDFYDDFLTENAADYPEWEQGSFVFERINPFDI